MIAVSSLWTLNRPTVIMAGVDTSGQTESRHARCWYTRRSVQLPADLGFHTIEDGLLVYCVHPMMFPVVRYHFDIRNCDDCEYYRPLKVLSDKAKASPYGR
jgi:hypothetical protein